RGLPLRAREPLQVLLAQHFVRELAPRAIDRGRLAALKVGRAFGPGTFAFARVDRAKDGVVFNPPRLRGDEASQLAGAVGVAAPFRLHETIERSAEGRLLQL